MPHFTVDYSTALSDAFDRRGFALALHPLTARVIDTAVDSCKTRFRPVEETVVADGATEHAVIHVEVAIMPGRTDEVKAELSRAVLELVLSHTAPMTDVVMHASVDVHDLSEAYRKHTASR
jgi:5-carboxymethyl-2-hydroxymuconate isomerase